MEVGHPHRHALSVSKFSLAPGSGMYDRTCWEGKGREGLGRRGLQVHLCSALGVSLLLFKELELTRPSWPPAPSTHCRPMFS